MDHIVGALRRVVSEPDNAAIEATDNPRSDDECIANYLAQGESLLTMDSASRPPAVVELDEPMHVDRTDAHMNADETGTSMSTSSSLSDGNDHPERMQRNYSVDSSVASSVRTRSSHNGSGNWGWFEDVHDSRAFKKAKNQMGIRAMPLNMNDASAMAVTAPTYVLEESLSSQKLWKVSAGTRPPQPVEERAFYEKMWAQNFCKSQVKYGIPAEVLTATSPISLSPFADGIFGTELCRYDISEDTKQSSDPTEAALGRLHGQNEESGVLDPRHTIVNRTVKGQGSDESLTVLVKGDNVFGTTVSKSFAVASEKGGPIEGVDTVNISVASYRVIESKKHGKYAQFLVIYREGSIRDTIGVWKRYSDFKELSQKVTHSHESCVSLLANMSPLAVTEEHDVEHLPNAITSWRLLKKRQRWYRCLDAGYLSLKVFLLERFLHDILFESSSPALLREFVGAESASDGDNNSQYGLY